MMGTKSLIYKKKGKFVDIIIESIYLAIDGLGVWLKVWMIEIKYKERFRLDYITAYFT